MRFIRVITLRDTEASSKEAFRKERAPLSSQIWTKIYIGWVKHSSEIQDFVWWIQEYLLIWETTKAVTGHEEIWNWHLYLRSLCKSLYQILEITILFYLHKIPSLTEACPDAEQKEDSASESWAPDLLSFLKHTRQRKLAWYKDQEHCDSNFTSCPPHVSKKKNKATIGSMRENTAPVLPFDWEGRPELEFKSVWQPCVPTNSISYNRDNGHSQLLDCQLAECHIRLESEEKYSQYHKLISFYGKSLRSTQKSQNPCFL